MWHGKRLWRRRGWCYKKMGCRARLAESSTARQSLGSRFDMGGGSSSSEEPKMQTKAPFRETERKSGN